MLLFTLSTNKIFYLVSIAQKAAKLQVRALLSCRSWTTTPWTLPANQAVALHADLDYALVQCDLPQGKRRILVAEALLGEVLTRYKATSHHVLGMVMGHSLADVKLQHPFYERTVPIVLADHVNTESGTGAVHTAPAHGREDYIVSIQYDLPTDNPVAGNGCFCF